MGPTDCNDVEATWRELRTGFVSRAARALGELQQAGLIRDVDVHVAANALGSMVEWTATTQFVLRMGANDASVEDTLGVLTDLWCHALFRD